MGHLSSLEQVQEIVGFEKVLIVPTSQNPLRAVTQGPTPEQRLEMVRRSVGSALSEKFEVLDLEVKRSGPSYTIDTLEELKKSYKGSVLYLILGIDILKNFHEWKDFSKILKTTNIVVTSRPGNELPKSKDDLPGWLRDFTKSFANNKVILKSNKTLSFIQLQDVHASSTDIRRRARNGEVISHLVTPAVEEFIRQEKLYTTDEVWVTDYEEMTRFCSKVAEEKGGLSITAYDVRELVQPSEYTLAISGTSTRHTRALCEHIMKEVKDRYGVYPQGTEGLSEGRWVVVDYGSLMIHVFYDFVRNEYRIEDLWSEAKRIT